MKNAPTPHNKMLKIVRNVLVGVLVAIAVDFFLGFLLSNSIIALNTFRFGLYSVWTVLVIFGIWTVWSVAYKTTETRQNLLRTT